MLNDSRSFASIRGFQNNDRCKTIRFHSAPSASLRFGSPDRRLSIRESCDWDTIRKPRRKEAHEDHHDPNFVLFVSFVVTSQASDLLPELGGTELTPRSRLGRSQAAQSLAKSWQIPLQSFVIRAPGVAQLL
jgi:hypothetical protein